jgi:hypothetical protein
MNTTKEGLPILSKCAWCNEWMNEESKLIASTRDKLEYAVSHGMCPSCYEAIEICEELDQQDDITPEIEFTY